MQIFFKGSEFTSRSCVMCVFVCQKETGAEKGLTLKCGIRLVVRGRRRVPAVRLAEVEAHLACLTPFYLHYLPETSFTNYCQCQPNGRRLRSMLEYDRAGTDLNRVQQPWHLHLALWSP
jgi:hypothetical protein